MVKLVAFDLDGTLIDSRQDLAAAVNFMRGSMGIAPLESGLIVSFLGDGPAALVRRAIADAEIDFDEALSRMKRYYADHVVDTTVLFSGAENALRELKEYGAKLAVVTNKPQAPTEKILSLLGVKDLFDDVIGGDADFPLKPEPDSLIHLMKKYSFEPAECWMVGDHYTDLESGRRAGFRRIFASYGFGECREETPDYEAQNFSDIPLILKGF